LFVVGDYTGDSTLNAALASAAAVTDMIVSLLGAGRAGAPRAAESA